MKDERGKTTRFSLDLYGRTNLTIFPAPQDQVGSASSVDDGAATYTGTGWGVASGGGVGGGRREATADGSSPLTATWSVAGLDSAKHYRIYVTWVPGDANADDVVYRLRSNGQQVGSDVTIDQSESPLNDEGVFFATSHAWRQLATAAPLDGTFEIELDASLATGLVVADAIRIEEVIPGEETEAVVYDALGQVSRTQNREQETTRYVYDELGRVRSVTSPTGKVTRFR